MKGVFFDWSGKFSVPVLMLTKACPPCKQSWGSYSRRKTCYVDVNYLVTVLTLHTIMVTTMLIYLIYCGYAECIQIDISIDGGKDGAMGPHLISQYSIGILIFCNIVWSVN